MFIAIAVAGHVVYGGGKEQYDGISKAFRGVCIVRLDPYIGSRRWGWHVKSGAIPLIVSFLKRSKDHSADACQRWTSQASQTPRLPD